MSKCAHYEFKSYVNPPEKGALNGRTTKCCTVTGGLPGVGVF